MKKMYGLLLVNFLLASAALAVPAKLVNITWTATPGSALPTSGDQAGTPGLYVKYATKSEIVLLDAAIDLTVPSPTLNRKLYLPFTVQFVKPIIAFQDQNGTLRYWYCKQQQSFSALPADNGSNGFSINFDGMPASAVSSPQNPAQELDSCTYQIV